MIIDFTHHAYLIEGDKERKEEILEFLRDSGFSIKSPDFLLEETETLTIDKARSVNEFHSRRVLKNNKKIVILSFTFATREAQNALLKTLEEPRGDTYFILIVPSKEMLLPTIKSRVQVVTEKGEAEEEINIETFIKLNPSERLERLQYIIKEKDKTRTLNFLNSLIEKLTEKKESVDMNYLETLVDSAIYLNDRAPNIKQILEYAALNLRLK